jgi:hypothetical protein
VATFIARFAYTTVLILTDAGPIDFSRALEATSYYSYRGIFFVKIVLLGTFIERFLKEMNISERTISISRTSYTVYDIKSGSLNFIYMIIPLVFVNSDTFHF